MRKLTIHKTKFKISTMIFAILFLVACGATGTELNDSNNQAPAYGLGEGVGSYNEVVFIQHADAITLDPHGNNDTASMAVSGQIFESLTAFNENGDLIPWLAHDFFVVDDYTWEFNLRQGVYFHDGEPFNAEAVRISFERLLNPYNASPRAFLLNMITYVNVVDDYTIQLTTEFPFSPLPLNLAHGAGQIISPVAIAYEESGGATVSDNPIGTGPFVLANRVHGYVVEMVRNENYWGTPVAFTYLTFRPIPDPATRLAVMESGAANVFIATAADVTLFEGNPNFDLQIVQSSRQEYLGFNTQVEPFTDVRVRRAISMLIDREAILYGIAEGQGIIADGPISPVVVHAPVPGSLVVPPHDVEAARELLAEAGFPNGFDTTIYVSYTNALNVTTAQIVQAWLGEVGINAAINQLSWGATLEATGEGTHQGLFLLGWTTLTGDADYSVFSVFHSESPGHSGNRTHYRNPELDELLEAARVSTNPEERDILYTEISQLLIDEAPMVFLFYPTFPFVTQGVDGLLVDFNGIPFFRNVSFR